MGAAELLPRPQRLHWLARAWEWLERGESFVVATVVAAAGSAPQPAGGKMLVSQSKTAGTLGGGKLEEQAIFAARALLADNKEQALRVWNLGAALGQCCGGKVAVLFEKQTASAPCVAVFGLGHVGQEALAMLARLPYCVAGADSRPAWRQRALAAAQAPTIWEADEDEMPDLLRHLPDGAHVLIMTHSHALDFALAQAAVAQGRFATVGVIGSAAKGRRFVARLQRQGASAAALAAFVCPIGEKAGTHPAEVAAAIVAETARRAQAGRAGKPPAASARLQLRLVEGLL